jgi:very-short-patch-repair endonuclease
MKIVYNFIRSKPILKSTGLRVIRFNNTDIKMEINAVLAAIQNEIGAIKNNPLTPFIKGEFEI